MSFKRTGTFLEEDIKEKVVEAFVEAQNTPVIALSSGQALSGRDLASQARDRAFKLLYDEAVAAGLPEIEGYYGLDSESGEVLAPE